MTFPPGKWSQLLIGDQWPDDQDITLLSQGRTNRGANATAFTLFAEGLHNARTGALTEQRGRTIDNLRSAFRNGEQHAQAVGERNSVKQKAYSAAWDSMLSLQHDLTALAEEANPQIEAIEHSKDPADVRAAEITAQILRYKAIACVVAAKYTGNVLDAIQRVLDADGAELQARQFVQTQGLDVGRMFQRPCGGQELSDRVRGMLGEIVPSEVLETGKLPTTMLPAADQTAQHSEPELQSIGTLPMSSQPVAVTGPAASANSPHEVLQTGQSPVGRVYRGPMAIPSAALPPTPVAAATRAHAAPVNPVGSPVGPIMGGHNGLAEPPLASLPHTQTITPTELAQSFNKGMESGAPFSAAAHAAPPLPVTSTEPQISHAAQTIPSAAPTPQVHVPVVDSPQPVHHVTAAETPPPTPIVAAAQPISPPVTPQAVGPLPTYGSDLRPPAATTITPTPPQITPLPPSATPSSAPVTPSSVHSAANQPAVVRQTASSTPPPPPPTQGTQAVAATATGAAIGTASADATARKRLQRLVNTVARQQPRLAWAAGDRADNTTLLVTDLASGWIPPGIDLPSAVTLLPPARRRGNVEVLLGDVTVTASYTPTHHLADDGEQTPTSSRPRSVPDVSDLGWELSQATQWRDGLPRLAHTLAKAASAGTGVLDSEIDLLHEHLAETSNRVLDNYPDHIDTHDVGNWQLLTALDALVVGDKATANYHLAWFLAAKAG